VSIAQHIKDFSHFTPKPELLWTPSSLSKRWQQEWKKVVVGEK